MEKPHFYIPSGLPPGATPMAGEEGPPPGVYYYRIYAGILAAFAALSFVGGIVFLITVAAPVGGGTAPSSSSDLLGVVSGLFYMVIGVGLFVPLLISLLAGRAAWVHTLGTVLLAVSMLSFCCIPFALPVLIVWLKPETKRWYGAY